MRRDYSYLYFFLRLALFLLLACCCLILMTNNSVIQRYAFFEKIRGVQISFLERSNNIKNYFSLNKVNEQLSKSNFLLLTENRRYKEILDSLAGDDLANYLESTLDSTSAQNRFIWANVVKNMVNTSHNYLIIDKGSYNGIVPDMGVITLNGAVGVVRGVGKHHAYIESFINTSQQISVNVGDSEALGILKWDGFNSNGAILSEIPMHINVFVGDTVRTSGYSSLYPSNIAIGEVVSSRVVKGTSLELEVELFQDFRSINYVIIVKNDSKKEIDSLSTIL